jgi:hypothetical protein
MNARVLAGASLLLLLTAACGDDTGGSGGSGSGTGSGASSASTASGEDCPEVSETEGGEACENEFCNPGDYCDGFVCGPGCENANTCPEGQYCDLSGADETNAGTCRNPPSSCTDGSSSSTSSSGGTPPDCEERCVDKLFECGFEEQVEDVNATCSQACDVLEADTLECLEAASCAALADGEECGVPFGD